jgi:Na+-transporting NADH:ubiquinone oxidoreductase subunit NqrD
MNDKSIDRLISFLCNLSAIVILVGALLKLQHYEYGKGMVELGFVAYIVFSSILVGRLKKTIKKLENRTIVE